MSFGYLGWPRRRTGVSGHRCRLPDCVSRLQAWKIWHPSSGIRVIFRKVCYPDNGSRVIFPKGLPPFYQYPGRFPMGWLPFYRYPVGKPLRFATRLPVDGSPFRKVCYPDNGSRVSLREVCHPSTSIRGSLRKVWSLSHGDYPLKISRLHVSRRFFHVFGGIACDLRNSFSSRRRSE
jgi:hypothetical protein